MRCTEGVWLAVNPWAEELIVSMDFEGRVYCLIGFTLTVITGIQSVERTQQVSRSLEEYSSV
jgi:hypothetical protein